MSENPAGQESHFSKWDAQKSPDRVAMTYDAAELARLREIAHEAKTLEAQVPYDHNCVYVLAFDPPTVLSIIDALEKSRGDVKHRAEAMRVLISERKSARSLLRKVAACGWVPPDLRARIEKELAQ